MVKEALGKESFRDAASADEANQLLTETIIAANKHCFSLKQGGANQNQVWWNNECKDASSKTRRLEREWRKHPADLQRRTEYQKSIAVKRRLILKRKREAWEHYCAHFTTTRGNQSLWNLMKTMSGKFKQGSNRQTRVQVTEREYSYEKKVIAKSLLKAR